MIFARAGRRGLLAGRGPTIAVDSTGLETRHVSAHYRGTRRRTGRRGRPRARYPTLTIATHTASHLIAGAVTGTGPAPDFAAFAPVMWQAAGLMPRIGAVVADAGFDAEPVHQLCRGPLGIRRTAIRLNPRRRLRTWPTTRYRRAMRRRFPERLYRRRQQVESVFSRTKRRLGSALTARSRATQGAESILRVLTHNLLLLWRSHRSFQQSHSDPIRLEKLLQRSKRLRTGAALDVVHQRDEPLREWGRHANLARERHDDTELRIDLRRTLADCQVTPDAAVGFG